MTVNSPIGDIPPWQRCSGKIKGGESLEVRYKFPESVGELDPWNFSPYASNHHPETYSVLDYSPERLIDITRQMEWTEYEVDPAWRNFCEFTHKDIGGPFEKLGIIRRKPRVDAVFCSPDMLKQIGKMATEVDKLIENNVLYGPPCKMFGIPVYENRYMPSHIVGTWRNI